MKRFLYLRTCGLKAKSVVGGILPAEFDSGERREMTTWKSTSQYGFN